MSALNLRKLIGCLSIFIALCVPEGAGQVVASPTQLQPIAAQKNGQSFQSIQLRLRISWGGGVARRWHGSLKFLDASIKKPSILGINSDSSAGIDVQSHAIRIQQMTASTFEGIDVDVEGSPDSVIQYSLVAEDGSEPIQQEIRLSDLISQDRVLALDDQDNRISFARAPGDQIQFATERDHLIFDAGESFAFQFRVNRKIFAEPNSECRIEIVPARSDEEPVSTTRLELNLDQTGSSAYINQLITVPTKEGVYDLRLQVGPRNHTPLLIHHRRDIVNRTVQFVVLDKAASVGVSDSSWEPALEIDPASLRSTVPQQLDQISRLIGIRSNFGPVGNYDVTRDSETSSVALPVEGWQAVPLEIAEPQTKHLVEITYDANQQMSLGFSILEADESGQVPNFGFDSGLSVPNAVVNGQATTEPSEGVHRFSFWPTSKRVFLLIANRDQKLPGSYQKVRLLVQAAKEVGGNEIDGQTAKRELSSGLENRRLMSFYEQPLFPENFGVHDQVDEQLHQSITDWFTFYEGARRLIQHLQDTGARGAFINVFGEGGALLPLTTTNVTPRYDSGIFSSLGSDPQQKDVVELIYRMFEQADLQFVPVVSFDHPLSKIEFLELDSASDSAVIDYRNVKRGGDENSNLPVYNPLSPIVQETVTSIVAEIAGRYRNRKSYAGIAVACRPDTYTLLPGSRIAGYDAITVSRFLESDPDLRGQNINAPSLLTEEVLPKWLAWRKEQMHNWYEKLDRLISSEKQRSKFYLALVDILRNEEVASMLSPSLHRSANIGDAMYRLGLTSQLANETNNIVLMKPNRQAPIHPLATRKSEFSTQRMRQLDEWFNNPSYAASIFSHRSSWARFENLEGSAFFADQVSPIMRLQQLSPAGIWNRERFAQSILNSDSRLLVDGGLLLNTSVDQDLKSFIDVYSQLPDANFETVSHATHETELHPVAVRYLNTDDGTVIYLVNGAPWEVTVTVQADGVITNDFVSFGRTDWLNVRSDEQPGQFQIKLKPFELLGGKVNGKTIHLQDFSYKLPETAHRDLNASYYKLRSKLIASGNARQLNALQNPGFENAGFIDGWTIGEQQADFLKIEAQESYEGDSALKIENQEDRSVWIRSNSFAAPVTGRLSVSVWLKTHDGNVQPPLRIAIESSDPGSNYYRFGAVGSLASDRQQNQLNAQWKRFAVHFDDLPQEQVNGFRIGFDMIGNGSVWIDQVQVFDRWMDENDVKAMTQLLASIGPLLQETEKMERCRQLLNGYWPTFLREYFDEESENPSLMSDSLIEQPVRSTMRQRFRRFVSPGIFQFR